MDKYERIRGGFLGKGAYGVVEKYVRKIDREVFACKTIHFRDEERHRNPALQEYNILSKLKHHNIVSYVDIVWEPTAAQIFMSLCGGGSLADFIASRTKSGGSHVSEHYISSVFSQLAGALLYCHHGITIQPDGQVIGSFWNWDPVIHRDIKPGNILLSTEVETEHVVVKLGDFGLSTFIDFENAPSTYIGTKQYLAPEISRSRQARNYWTKMCDIFSLACSIWELGSLATQFSGHMDVDDEYKDLPDIYSTKLNGRIAACMSISPERRPDASDLLKSLRQYQQEMGFKVESQDVSSSNSIRTSTITLSPDHVRSKDDEWRQKETKILSQYANPEMLGVTQAEDPILPGRGTNYQDVLGTRLDSTSSSSRTPRGDSTIDLITQTPESTQTMKRMPQLVNRREKTPIRLGPKYEASQEDALTREYNPMPVRLGTKNAAPQDDTPVAGPVEEARPPSKPRMKLRVRSLSGKVYDVHVDTSGSIRDIKQKVSEAGGPSVHLQRLFLAGKQLEDNRLIRACNIHPEAILHVALKREARDSTTPTNPLKPERKEKRGFSRFFS